MAPTLDRMRRRKSAAIIRGDGILPPRATPLDYRARPDDGPPVSVQEVLNLLDMLSEDSSGDDETRSAGYSSLSDDDQKRKRRRRRRAGPGKIQATDTVDGDDSVAQKIEELLESLPESQRQIVAQVTAELREASLARKQNQTRVPFDNGVADAKRPRQADASVTRAVKKPTVNNASIVKRTPKVKKTTNQIPPNTGPDFQRRLYIVMHEIRRQRSKALPVAMSATSNMRELFAVIDSDLDPIYKLHALRFLSKQPLSPVMVDNFVLLKLFFERMHLIFTSLPPQDRSDSQRPAAIMWASKQALVYVNTPAFFRSIFDTIHQKKLEASLASKPSVPPPPQPPKSKSPEPTKTSDAVQDATKTQDPVLAALPSLPTPPPELASTVTRSDLPNGETSPSLLPSQDVPDLPTNSKQSETREHLLTPSSSISSSVPPTSPPPTIPNSSAASDDNAVDDPSEHHQSAILAVKAEQHADLPLSEEQYETQDSVSDANARSSRSPPYGTPLLSEIPSSFLSTFDLKQTEVGHVGLYSIGVTLHIKMLG